MKNVNWKYRYVFWVRIKTAQSNLLISESRTIPFKLRKQAADTAIGFETKSKNETVQSCIPYCLQTARFKSKQERSNTNGRRRLMTHRELASNFPMRIWLRDYYLLIRKLSPKANIQQSSVSPTIRSERIPSLLAGSFRAPTPQI